jgi:hypothetical protein
METKKINHKLKIGNYKKDCTVVMEGWINNVKPPDGLPRDEDKAFYENNYFHEHLFVSREFALSIGIGDLISFESDVADMSGTVYFKNYDVDNNTITVFLDDTDISYSDF